MNDKSDMYSNFGIAAIVLAFCIGVSACDMSKSYSSKVDAERKLIEQQLKPRP